MSESKQKNRRPNTYLVMLECSWDDAPLRVFTDPKEAEQYAKSLSVLEALNYGEKLLQRGNLTEPLMVSIVRFNAAGFAKSHRIVRELEDEDTNN